MSIHFEKATILPGGEEVLLVIRKLGEPEFRKRLTFSAAAIEAMDLLLSMDKVEERARAIQDEEEPLCSDPTCYYCRSIERARAERVSESHFSVMQHPEKCDCGICGCKERHKK
jgi:hypothetical protein